MFKGISIIKKYYNLAKIKRGFIFLQFVLLLIPSLLSILTPIYSADIISALTVYDFSRAIYKLSLNFIIVLISSILYFIYHLVSRKINKLLYYNFNEYLYENIKKNKNLQTINLPTITNVAVCADFNKELLYKCCFFIKSIIILGIIFYFSHLICLIIIAVSVVTFLLLNITDKHIQINSKNLSNIEQQSLDLFNSIHKGNEIEENYNLNVILKEKYFSNVNGQVKSQNKISLLFSINNNFISFLLKLTIFLITIHLIGLVKSTTLTLSLYLILTPYLTSSAQNLISFFEIFSKFGTIDNILTDFEALEFQEKPKQKENFTFSNYNLYFYKVYAKQNETNLKNLNIEIPFGSIVSIYSENKNQLLLFNDVLQKNKTIESGSIFLDNKNISDINNIDYKKIVSFTNSNPFFFNISIFENLSMVCKNDLLIKKSIKNFELKPLIDALPKKLNTIIDEKFDKDLLFLLGILRCYLSGAKIICISMPTKKQLNAYDGLFLKILKVLKNKCTVIVLDNDILKLKTEKNYSIIKNSLKENE